MFKVTMSIREIIDCYNYWKRIVLAGKSKGHFLKSEDIGDRWPHAFELVTTVSKLTSHCLHTDSLADEFP